MIPVCAGPASVVTVPRISIACTVFAILWTSCLTEWPVVTPVTAICTASIRAVTRLFETVIPAAKLALVVDAVQRIPAFLAAVGAHTGDIVARVVQTVVTRFTETSLIVSVVSRPALIALHKVITGGIVVFFAFLAMREVIRAVEFAVWHEPTRKAAILAIRCRVSAG